MNTIHQYGRDSFIEKTLVVFLRHVQNSNPSVYKNLFPCRMNAHSQNKNTFQDQAKIYKWTALPIQWWASIYPTWDRL